MKGQPAVFGKLRAGYKPYNTWQSKARVEQYNP